MRETVERLIALMLVMMVLLQVVEVSTSWFPRPLSLVIVASVASMRTGGRGGRGRGRGGGVMGHRVVEAGGGRGQTQPLRGRSGYWDLVIQTETGGL